MSWVPEFFDDAYADAALLRPPADDVVDALVERLGLPEGARVLDQCCGLGRLTRALCARGLQAEGVELIPRYVERARGLGGTFHCADAGAFRPERPVHAVVNWWSSFGYDADDAINARLLHAARSALVDGGVLALELTHGPYVHAHFRPELRQVLDGVPVTRHSELRGNLLVQVWQLGEDPRPRRGTTRLYTAPELTLLLEQAGFSQIDASADLAGTPLSRDTPRMVLVAR